jgi:hypothetical protein
MLVWNVITIRQSQGVLHANRCPPGNYFRYFLLRLFFLNTCEEASTNRDRKRWREFVSARGRAGRKRERGAQYSSYFRRIDASLSSNQVGCSSQVDNGGRTDRLKRNESNKIRKARLLNFLIRTSIILYLQIE